MPAAALDASAPGMPRSMTVTPIPRWASRSATSEPMIPPPMTATSLAPSLATLLLRSRPSDPIRGGRRTLKLSLERLRDPDLVLRVDDQRRAVRVRIDQLHPLLRAEDEDRIVERVGQEGVGREDRHLPRRRG